MTKRPVSRSRAGAPRQRASRSTKMNKKRVGRTRARSARLGIVDGLIFLLQIPYYLLRWLLRFVWRFVWRVGLIGVVIVTAAAGVQYSDLPEMSTLLDGRARGSVTLLDRNGAVFAWRGQQFGGVITEATVSEHLKHAILATEDKRFYRHFGLSPRGIVGAVWINVSEGRGPLSGHGGSTITQQVAKLLCLGVQHDPESGQSEVEFELECRRGTVWRKMKEAVYAIALELKYSKDEILTIYMNRAFLGAGSVGFEAASQRYFGISATAVDPAQAAMLAGLLVAPSRYAPTNNLERSQNRAATILRLMRDQGYLSEEQHQNAMGSPARLSAAASARAGGYFADWVMSSGPNYFTRNTTEDVIIKTTLDTGLQSDVEAAVSEVFNREVRAGSQAQVAVVVMRPDGAVRAMVGGRKSQPLGAFNRATQALRQTGSSFKPFVYAAALDVGRSPGDIVLDQPFCMTVSGSGEWCPRNYSNEFLGRVTLTEAFKDSLNIPAVKISESVGRQQVHEVARKLGLHQELANGPALALGTAESTLIDMTGAYAGILSGGLRVTPYGMVELRLVGERDPVMERESGLGESVISSQSAAQLIWMMTQVIADGTGRRAALPDGRPVAGKTGTTQAARDAWFIGFSADYVVGVWMGYDDNTPLTGVTGGGLPAEIWKETMLRIHGEASHKPLPLQNSGTRRRGVIEPKDQLSSGFLENLLGTILGLERENIGTGSGTSGGDR
ncbi:MAG: transglycosylase domain-containing protein [Aestuariivita sp.]|nr:transglycosylase domain-containing protein [Aestuariivita sp.]MCY4202990.1 transglycosylase domain-containing protein [Aestuariivita sp.]